MKKAGIGLLALSLIAGGMNVGGAVKAADLGDIKGHWAESGILQAVAAGYVNGYEDGSFRPEASVSKAEFVKLLVGALGVKVETQQGNDWFQPYVDAAKQLGIYVQGEFADASWNQSITREDMAMLAVRASGYKTTRMQGMENNKTDIWQKTPMNRKQWLWEATRAGIVLGVSPGEVAPQGVTTRAQSITVINRVLAIKSGQKLATDKYAISAAEIYWHKTNILSTLPQYFLSGHLNGYNVDMPEKFVGKKGSSEVLGLFVVDMDDPKDPLKKYLPKDAGWKYTNKNGDINKRTDMPTNCFAAFSVQHFTYDSTQEKYPDFYVGRVSIYGDLKDNSGELLKKNLPYATHLYSTYVKKRETLIADDYSPLMKIGKIDVTYSVGQLIPKAKLGTDGDTLHIDYMPSRALGEFNSKQVYFSRINYSLANQ